MRIVHLIQSSPHVYGAERCALWELAALRRRGHDARAVVLREARMGAQGDALSRALREQGIPVDEVLAKGRVSAGLLGGLWRILRGLRPDVVQSHSLKTDVLGFLVTRPLRLPFVVELHGWLRPEDDRLVRAYEALDRAVLRRSAGVLVLSTDYRDEVIGLGVAPEAVHLLPSGIDVAGLRGQVGRRDLRAELGIAPATPVAGIVARLSPEKGHHHFLRALHGARQPGASGTGPAELPVGLPVPAGMPVGLIVGEGPLRAELSAAADRLGLGGAVYFTGYLPEVADAYRALDVLVSCSLYEGLPLNLIEAMALGVPVLAMATGGCADIVVAEPAPLPTGILVPRGDGEGLARGLSRLCRDRDLRQRLGAAGAVRAQEHYSLDAWAEGAERIYESMRR